MKKIAKYGIAALLLAALCSIFLCSCGGKVTGITPIGDGGKERLTEALNEKIPADAYTAGSYAVYEGAYAAAEELLAKENVTALEADKAIEDLNAAARQLVKKANFSELKKAIDSFDMIDPAKYTAASYADYKTAYDNACAVYAVDTSKQSEINSAVTAMSNAIKALEKLADTSTLAELMEEKYASASDFTSASYESYREAYEFAASLLKLENPKVSDLKLAETMLCEAYELLVPRVDPSSLGEKVGSIEKDLLKNDQKNRTPAEHFGSVGYENMMRVLREAKNAVSTGDISAEGLNALAAELDDAERRLVDISALLDVYELASGYSESDTVYTEQSTRALNEAMSEGLALCSSPDLDEAKAAQAVERLSDAIAGMERIAVTADGKTDKKLSGLSFTVGRTVASVDEYVGDYTSVFFRAMNENNDFAPSSEGEGGVLQRGGVRVIFAEKSLKLTYTGRTPVSASDRAAASFAGIRFDNSEFDVASSGMLGSPTSYGSRSEVVMGKENKIAILTYVDEDDDLKLTVEYNTIGNYIVSVEIVSTCEEPVSEEPEAPEVG